MFGLSGEHLLILAGVLLIFGPRKLPELGSSVGKALRNFKEGFNHPPRQESQTEVKPQIEIQQASVVEKMAQKPAETQAPQA
ncbi:MAG: twin-arginine translocase TatA/TatE family subunit [Bacteriovoracia bacterium]